MDFDLEVFLVSGIKLGLNPFISRNMTGYPRIVQKNVMVSDYHQNPKKCYNYNELMDLLACFYALFSNFSKNNLAISSGGSLRASK